MKACVLLWLVMMETTGHSQLSPFDVRHIDVLLSVFLFHVLAITPGAEMITSVLKLEAYIIFCLTYVQGVIYILEA